MTEDDARDWIAQRFGVGAIGRLDQYSALVAAEATHQNLVAPSTLPVFWTRHILDSAQLVPLAEREGAWLDIGSGAGLPGLVVAILRDDPVLLVEPRRQRAGFLQHCVDVLALQNVKILQRKVEQMALPVPVISARAVASVEKLLHAAAACATTQTRWLLPRGHVGTDEIAALQSSWRGMFHMKQSLTDPASFILICDGPMLR